jgi:hypothetical protein
VTSQITSKIDQCQATKSAHQTIGTKKALNQKIAEKQSIRVYELLPQDGGYLHFKV